MQLRYTLLSRVPSVLPTVQIPQHTSDAVDVLSLVMYSASPQFVHVSKIVSIINWFEKHHAISPQHPVTWQPSKEGDHLIGRITLSKRSAVPREAGSLLGLKVRLTGYKSQILYLYLCLSRKPSSVYSVSVQVT